MEKRSWLGRLAAITLGGWLLLVASAVAAVPVLDEWGGSAIGESSFDLNASGTGVRFFGFNAKQTLSISLALDATGDGALLTIANATQKKDFHETDPPYVQLEETTVIGSWSGPVDAFIRHGAGPFPGLDLLFIELASGDGHLAQHGQSGDDLNLSGSLDPSAFNVLLVYYVNADGAETFGLPEGSVFALDGLMRFVDEDDPAAVFGIGPNLPIVRGQTDVPIGKPIPGGQGLRGRNDHVSGRLRY